MVEYTIVVILVFLGVIVLDRQLKTNAIRLSPRLVKTTGVFLLFQLVFDNYFTSQGLWMFDVSKTLGIFIPFIPVENLVYGTALLWLTLVLYAFFQRR